MAGVALFISSDWICCDIIKVNVKERNLMLQNFIICVEAVLPQAVFLAIGLFIMRIKLVTSEDVKKFTSFTFKLLYPFMMFDNLYGKNLEENMDWPLVIYAVSLLAVLIAGSWGFVCLIEKEDRNRGAMIQAIFRSNIVLMGLPVAINLFGKGNVTEVAVVLLFIVPLYNVMSVIILEKFRGGKTDPKVMIHKVVTNPIIVGAIAAIIAITFKIDVPDVIMQPVTALADSTAPIAMVLLGASLSFKGIKNSGKQVAICVIGKLIIVPAIGIGGAVLLGFTDVALVAILLMVASPTALASFAMASSMGSNGELAGSAIVFSTLLSCVTMPIWLFILKTMGLF